ncbi:hypothetical protein METBISCDRAFT_26561 [Metschnikowia bicuspidata]|uniref:25S rRNA (uridine-N(3))-methyltransferase BMT5-like domain-containing protein n=1 Tax=Metschnikowia bicuspidata TaxID=27322 RepID=A0A4P9ZGU8_9ASCO|nr:hypothetical protein METBISCDRAFT_26561 [Metschnikowia bicuspidata]
MGRKLKGRPLTGKGLKGALQNHQILEEYKKKRSAALLNEQKQLKDEAASIKSGTKSSKTKSKQQQRKKAYIPFDSTDTLLLVGEGDFTFALSLVVQGLVAPENLTATSFDTHEELVSKYPDVQKVLDSLKKHDVHVLHGVDCMKLAVSLNLNKKYKSNLFLPPKPLQNIMFNFPHTGRGMKDVDRNIRDHQKLVLSYFQNCKEVFEIVNSRRKTGASDGFAGYGGLDGDMPKQKIILSLFEGEPYVSWGIKALARSVGYKVERSGAMDWTAFKGYHHKRTNSIRDTTKPATERDARIYVFDKVHSKEKYKLAKKKSKSNTDDSDSE